jgi:hypothetical protein
MMNMNSNTPKIVQYLDLQAQKLRIALQAARLFVGTTDIGNVAENAFRQFLDDVLPAKYSVGVGEAIAPDGTQPKRIDGQTQQKDVIIHDPYGSAIFGWGNDQPRPYSWENQLRSIMVLPFSHRSAS